MEELLTTTASPGEGSPLHNIDIDASVFTNVSGGDADIHSPEGDGPYTIVLSAESLDYTELLQQLCDNQELVLAETRQHNDLLREQNDTLINGFTAFCIVQGLILGALLMQGFWHMKH